jgi:hypothetical protein
VIDPLLQRGDHVERVRSLPAAAVAHARRQEQPVAISDRAGAAARVLAGEMIGE